jgi:DNA-binding response OmpR family regulator
MTTSTHKRVLLVEDQVLLAHVMEALLSDAGFHVEAAENGGAAMEKLRGSSYDLVISDLQMPVMDGVQLLEWIRQEATLAVPVIILSANTNGAHIQRVKDLGVLAILKKPLAMDNFAANISALLEAHA